MLEQVPLDTCVGKTIKSLPAQFGQQLFVFTDGTFVALQAKSEYDCNEIEEFVFDPLCFNHVAAIEAGIVTAEEIERLTEARDAKYRVNLQEQRRQQYEQLKKEFGT